MIFFLFFLASWNADTYTVSNVKSCADKFGPKSAISAIYVVGSARIQFKKARFHAGFFVSGFPEQARQSGIQENTMKQPVKKPIFYDVTLRDGNQALRCPWNLNEKLLVFNQLVKLGVQGVEAGFASASQMDFEACRLIASQAPPGMIISSLSRAVEFEIEKSWEAIQCASAPRVHIVLALSPFTMEHMLRLKPAQVLEKAVKTVSFARSIMGGRGSIQFSAEHFGDCIDNLDFAIEALKAVADAGAAVVNLANTVERYRPAVFVRMVEKVVSAMPGHVTVAVHAHNDLGMATATTVESYFAGASQLETALNGLGERSGNTNMYETACALSACGIEVPLNFDAIFETAHLVSRMTGIAIPEKAPLIGEDIVSHRSGMHQDGASKTKNLEKGAYRAFDLQKIGRTEREQIRFTSQSGKAAVYEILRQMGIEISRQDAARMQPILKKISEMSGGELTCEEIADIYRCEFSQTAASFS